MGAEEDYCTDVSAEDLMADFEEIMKCLSGEGVIDGETIDTGAYSTCAGEYTFKTDLGSECSDCYANCYSSLLAVSFVLIAVLALLF